MGWTVTTRGAAKHFRKREPDECRSTKWKLSLLNGGKLEEVTLDEVESGLQFGSAALTVRKPTVTADSVQSGESGGYSRST